MAAIEFEIDDLIERRPSYPPELGAHLDPWINDAVRLLLDVQKQLEGDSRYYYYKQRALANVAAANKWNTLVEMLRDSGLACF